MHRRSLNRRTAGLEERIAHLKFNQGNSIAKQWLSFTENSDGRNFFGEIEQQACKISNFAKLIRGITLGKLEPDTNPNTLVPAEVGQRTTFYTSYKGNIFGFNIGKKTQASIKTADKKEDNWEMITNEDGTLTITESITLKNPDQIKEVRYNFSWKIVYDNKGNLKGVSLKIIYPPNNPVFLNLIQPQFEKIGEDQNYIYYAITVIYSGKRLIINGEGNYLAYQENNVNSYPNYGSEKYPQPVIPLITVPKNITVEMLQRKIMHQLDSFRRLLIPESNFKA